MATSTDTLVLVLVGITVAWAVLSLVVLRRSRHRRRAEVAFFHAQPRRRVREDAGTFVPLAPANVQERPEPEHESEPEAEFWREAEPDPLPPHPGDLGTATLYEIVWYREDERIVFALQPVDGRAEPWVRYRSASFAWEEDRDPPASLRDAQRAHGRLKARLERDGWHASGRGGSWFSHRFEPPEEPPEP